MKINDGASVDISEFREPYIGMPIYVDKRDHERYYGRRGRRGPAGDILEDLLEGELLEDIIQGRSAAKELARDDPANTNELSAEGADAGAGARETPEGVSKIKGAAMRDNIESYCRDSMFESWPIAMAYVPWQSFREIFEPAAAFQAGTIFSELDLPFLGGGGR